MPYSTCASRPDHHFRNSQAPSGFAEPRTIEDPVTPTAVSDDTSQVFCTAPGPATGSGMMLGRTVTVLLTLPSASRVPGTSAIPHRPASSGAKTTSVL